MPLTVSYKKISFFLLGLLFSFFVAAQDARSTVVKTIEGKKYYIHTVQKNQSLYAIAKLYAIDLNNLLAENPDAIDGLKQGDELKIPVKPEAPQSVTSPSDLEKYNFHKVQKKETLYGICKKYSITEEQLKAMNPEIQNGLKEGQLLKVGLKESAITTTGAGTQIAPGNFKEDSAYTWHNVRDGESLYAISRLYNSSQDEILKLNPGMTQALKAGQKIRVKEKISSQSNEIRVGNSVYIKDTTRVPLRPKKNKYAVGIFLPLQTTEVDMAGLDWYIENKKNFPNVSSLTADFYEGYSLALDSLKASDFDVKTVIFDVNENDSAKIAAIVSSDEFKKLDFIIGPWFASAFRPVALAARDFGIAIVAPTISHNKVLFQNPLASKIVPSKNSLAECLAEYCADSLRTGNIFIINNGKPKDQPGVKIFKEAYNSYLKVKYNLTDTLKEVPGLAGVKSSFNETKKNVYILLTENTGYVTEFFNQLGAFINDKKEITIVGNLSWTNIENLDAGYFTRYNFITAAPFFVDKNDAFTTRLWKQYRSTYFSDPDEIFFQAYDMTLYYLDQLKKTGPDFWMNLDKSGGKGAVMNFNFFSPASDTGFENRCGKILKVADYKIMKVN
jgi:LysM repeat protein/ABC-type branched-subunit amino acid transport system substrate-binding protein